MAQLRTLDAGLGHHLSLFPEVEGPTGRLPSLGLGSRAPIGLHSEGTLKDGFAVVDFDGREAQVHVVPTYGTVDSRLAQVGFPMDLDALAHHVIVVLVDVGVQLLVQRVPVDYFRSSGGTSNRQCH